MLRKSVAMPSQQASAVLSNCHIKRAIRHKNMQNIPDIWPYPQLSVLLHRQKIKIARPYWGKGICTEALQMVIDYCFNEKGFITLWGDYFPSNPASGRVMEKCGFVDTGEETLCPNLEVGSDCPVRVMKLIKK